MRGKDVRRGQLLNGDGRTGTVRAIIGFGMKLIGGLRRQGKYLLSEERDERSVTDADCHPTWRIRRGHWSI